MAHPLLLADLLNPTMPLRSPWNPQPRTRPFQSDPGAARNILPIGSHPSQQWPYRTTFATSGQRQPKGLGSTVMGPDSECGEEHPEPATVPLPIQLPLGPDAAPCPKDALKVAHPTLQSPRAPGDSIFSFISHRKLGYL
ncbi:hypothetical protein K505DRAFT_365710 [Melanomma pulvis-pyrius CBS 109.77]|uniref:Uncharacterized protein n=1 Tax=Melanomma pulvis-pyrius CBS 109.77 TaxID=1314802 RepID=A0A6A6WZG4_9PLEO|nr:hypothetical protein K505DRAFT_365710 [Melanomma pulvis-pyrius CBS 109.77]